MVNILLTSPILLVYSPILCTYLDGIEFSSQHANAADELKHHLRLIYKKNTSINVTRPKSAPNIVVLSILAAKREREEKVEMVIES